MRVTVVMPCFNAARFIGEAIESALRQTHPGTSILVVDDGSTDGTAELAAAYGRRVTVLRQLNAGPSAARNRAIERSTAEFIAFLDADDRWHPEKLARQVAFLQAHPAVPLVHTNVRYIDAAGEVVGAPPWPMAQGDCLGPLLGRNSITTSAVLMRADVLRREHFLPGLRAAEDWDLWLRLASRASIGCVADELTDYRIHDSNTVRREEFMRRGELTVIERALARGLEPEHATIARHRRRRIAVTLGHYAYERGEMAIARRWFVQGGRALDPAGRIRCVATCLPEFIRKPAREYWSRVNPESGAEAAALHGLRE